MPSSSRVPALVAALAAVAVAMSGCASPEESAGSPPGRSAAPTPLDPPLEPSLDPHPAGRQGALITVTGVLAEGVEAGCVLLEGQGRTLLLLGLPRDTATFGTRVQVTGRVRRDVATICQQGVPLQVTRLRRLGH